MALDTLDISVLAAIVVALIVFFTKGSLWGTSNSGNSTTVSSSGSRDLIEVLNENNKKALVIYGSQTGTAEDYAHKYAKEFQARFGIPTMCIDMSDFDYDNLPEVFDQVSGFKLITFFMATYGEGEPTDNAVDFFECVDNELTDLNGLKFSCFGLGNSTYEFYNAMGKRLTQTLLEKNATMVGELGLGDDGAGSMDEDYLAWKDGLFDLLKDSLNLEEKEVSYEPSLKVTEVSDLTIEDKQVALGEPNAKYTLRAC
ncbi:unnamed protein product [Ambrosiozyma monospora]|uniref:Unnamed protein product n=1 Tax=Ambrosiozyma monospora TaxID=43982 RepID=A0ACB5SZK3_AMBMO|nr:unnamed protein product [Ambrosiozyma monospora]